MAGGGWKGSVAFAVMPVVGGGEGEDEQLEGGFSCNILYRCIEKLRAICPYFLSLREVS